MRIAELQASKNRIQAAHKENRQRHISQRASSRQTTQTIKAQPKKTFSYKQWMSPVAKPNKNVLFNVEHSGSTPVFHNRVMQSPKSFKRVSSNASEAMQNYRKFQNKLEFAKKQGPLQN